MTAPQPVIDHQKNPFEEYTIEVYSPDNTQETESLELPYEDGIPMESNWHRLQMNLLIEIVEQYWQNRDDYFAGGNMFIYFNKDQVKNMDYRGPDFFVVKNTTFNQDRLSWIVWQEQGKFPNVILELASPSTIKTDLNLKKELYENVFKTPEYFCYDPMKKKLYGWRIHRQQYKPIKPDNQGRMECRELGLWIGPWQGTHFNFYTTWLRFYTKDGQLVLKYDEAAEKKAEAEAKRAEIEAKRAETETKRAEIEAKKAIKEAKRADKEAQRARAAEKEIERLKALLVEQNIR